MLGPFLCANLKVADEIKTYQPEADYIRTNRMKVNEEQALVFYASPGRAQDHQ